MKTLSCVFAASLVAAMPTVSIAQAQGDVVQVSYADLNLNSEVGRDVFDRRIKRAVVNVCGGAAKRDVNMHQSYKTCIAATTKLAVAERDLAVANSGTRLAANQRVIRFAVN